MLQRLSADAEGMDLGTNIVLLPLHNPVEMAEICAFLDVISGGRFHLGVGLGYRPEEFAIFQVPIAERVSRLTESVEIIRRLWSEDHVTHKGRHWQLDDVTIRPRPIQNPRPPIMIGAHVDAAVERAARIGDGWCMVPTSHRDEIERHATMYVKAREAAGLPPAQHLVRLFEVACAPDEATALKRAAPFLLTKYASYASWGLPGLNFKKEDAREIQLKNLAHNRFAVGSPSQVADVLIDQHRLGVTHVTMRLSWPGMKQDDILAGIEILAARSCPRFAAGQEPQHRAECVSSPGGCHLHQGRFGSTMACDAP